MRLEVDTPRLVLRDFVMEDFAQTHAYVSDPEVCRHEPWGPNTEADSRRFIEMALSQQEARPRIGYELAMIEKARGIQIGSVGLHVTSEVHRNASLGYVLRRDGWHQGFGTEAARAMIEFGFVQLGLHRISATVATENMASIRLLERIGMQREGRMRGHQWIRTKWSDSWLYAILENDRRS